MRNLYIDFDGVILDTINTTNKMMSSLNINCNMEPEKTNFYANLDWKKVIELTPEINNSIECINKIIDSNRFDVAILTHVHSLEEIIQKVKFIRKHIPHITVISVPKHLSKTTMVRAQDSILIDDYCANLREWQEAGGLSIHFSVEHENKGFITIDRLDQMLDVKLTTN